MQQITRLVTLYAMLITAICYSQNQTNNWFFGSNLGLNFSGGNPILITGSAMNQAEGNATASDELGNLLFYTSGTTIWNRNNVVMTNGAGLLGHASSTQSAIIVQKPLSNNIYYVFTADAELWPNGIRYSEVDMSLSAGLGAVTSNKNVLLITPSCEKLTAVRHCNNVDVWVISHDYNANTFRTWLVTSAGVNLTPIISNTGYAPISVTQQGYGYLKANSSGDKLAAAYYGANNSTSGNRVEIYDFNKSTGQVSNAISLGNVNGAYGVEFSRSGRYLYASTNPGYLYQWDLCASNIQGSKYLVSYAGAFFGALQMGKDGKIYCVRGINKWISRISNPEVYGGGCGFLDQAIITPSNSNFGLPNFASYYLYPQPYMFSNQRQGCDRICFTANQLMTCTSQTPTYKWTLHDGVQFGITACTSIIPNTNQSVMLEIIYPCRIDTVIQNSYNYSVINALLTIN